MPASTKLSPIEVASKFADREPKCERWSEEIHKS